MILKKLDSGLDSDSGLRGSSTRWLLWGLVLILIACQQRMARYPTVPPSTKTFDAPAPATPSRSTEIVESTSVPLHTSTSSPTSIPSPTITSTPVPGPKLELSGIRVWPTPLYVGDWASFDVIPNLPADTGGRFTVTVDLPALGDPSELKSVSDDGQVSNANVLTSKVFPQGLDHRPRARFYWAWLAEGSQKIPQITETVYLTFSLLASPDVSDPDPTDNRLLLPVTLRPRSELFTPALATEWAFTETQGFRLYYLTHTAAERDLSELVAKAAEAYGAMTATEGGQVSSPTATRPMPFYFNKSMETVDIYLLDRVIGQGGYASGEWVAVSYTDRHYAPRNLDLILRHELVHRLDDAIGCRAAPTLLREGLAVYSAGGHYWLESLPLKAAALLQINSGDPGSDSRLDVGRGLRPKSYSGLEASAPAARFIPLDLLVENFYTHQHEIGYLEAGAVVAYVAEQLGWEGVEDLCRASAKAQGTDEERLNAGLKKVMAMDLLTFEQTWLRWVSALHPSAQEIALLELDWAFMETMRAYQIQFDPGANFLFGILFSPAEAVAAATKESRDLTANFMRRPRAPEAIALELLLVMAQDARQVKDLDRMRECLTAVNAVLEDGFSSTGAGVAAGVAADVLAIVRSTLAYGYEPYRLTRNVDEYGEGRVAPAANAKNAQPLLPSSYLVYALDYSAWPEQRILVAARDDTTWQVTGPQTGE